MVRRRLRRTRRHRRNRLLRRLLAVLVLGVVAGVSARVALHYLTPSVFRAEKANPAEVSASELARNDFVLAQQQALVEAEKRPVYPYSIVRGGVRNAKELKWAADHDPVVRTHYAGFDYDHARVVRLVLARSVYVSYRIGNKVYWTHRRLTLKKGETVLTDGKMTARTRCGNRVEEMPQQATSTAEPSPEKFDQPEQPAAGTAMSTPPVPFESALNSRPGVPGLGPAPPLTLYDPLSFGPWTPLNPPPLPGVCGGGKKKNGSSGGGGKKGKGNPCGPGGGGGGGEVPEPGTWFLVGSGLAFTYWIRRRHQASM